MIVFILYAFIGMDPDPVYIAQFTKQGDCKEVKTYMEEYAKVRYPKYDFKFRCLKQKVK